ncbi:MauE/DoxX family redox-associated membrane protein [Actinomadura alba]|uniref:Methylamine utilisation protein MauE domain-containing protein n=1 Tax=Actinomadura alba TaxID=406431 RepID=A0ABR7LQX0_9ACTN|nr:MauE/DoxX family redox-associated membrane protein [Actinomadura alba]MBC6466798.1 hypothetical protein [Actinomadura alba]
MVEAFQSSQLLLISAALITACLSKLANPGTRPRTIHGVTASPPVLAVRDSRPIAVGLALTEGALGVALLVTPHPSVRVVTIMGFASATWVVSELRTHRPEDGCGCFGALSAGRIGMRCVVRTALFTGAAIIALGVPYTGIDVLRASLGWGGVVLAAEILMFVALSPEADGLLGRLRSSAPCELRTAPLSETYRMLRASDAWREHENLLAGREPVDVWRELCWRFVAYEGRVAGREVEIVFAVSMEERHPVVRGAVLANPDRDGSAGATVAGSTLSSAAGGEHDRTGEGCQGRVPRGSGDEEPGPDGDGGEGDTGEDTGLSRLAVAPVRNQTAQRSARVSERSR